MDIKDLVSGFLNSVRTFKQRLPANLKKIRLYFVRLIFDFREFLLRLSSYLIKNFRLTFFHLETTKGIFVTSLYRQRGKHARRLVHSGMAGLAALGIMIAPVIANEFPGTKIDPWEIPLASSILSVSTEDPETQTLVSEKLRDKIIEYSVQKDDTLSTIAEKFGVSVETILWQNNFEPQDKIKPGQTLEILPVTGISHKVVKGDTVYSIAKRYDTSPQALVDFPYNTFMNDETFELAVGQVIIVPDGIRPKAQVAPRIRRITPDAGTVVASGAFVWPASGTISQNFVWYHKGLDIANKAAPNVLAADSGKVVISGWPDGFGYGNRVIMDHGNGYRTLYGHMSVVFVISGQSVERGAAIGKMGCTGRCTGTHLHFEVIKDGVYLNPLSVLK